MNCFVLNTGSLPLYDKKEAENTLDEVFTAFSSYIDDNSFPVLYLEKWENELIISGDYSLDDYLVSIQTRDRVLADFLSEYFDHLINNIIDPSLLSYEEHIKIDDTSQYEKNVSLLYACRTNGILITITDNPFWKREKLDYSLYIDNKKESEGILYNLFSKKIDYLPIEIPPFSLNDTKRFKRTGRKYKKVEIFEEVSTGNLWYFDFFHKDSSPHFEVFNSTGKNHIGEANMEGLVDTSKADKSKRLNHVL